MRTWKGELLEFATPDELILHGFFSRPAQQSSHCIVYIHGMAGNFYRHALISALREEALKKGLSFCAINTRGHDTLARVSKTGGKRISGGTAVEHFEDSVFDIQGALAALKRLGFRKFSLVGHSTGCQKITWYQYKKKDNSVESLVLLAPADDYNTHQASAGRLRWQLGIQKARFLMSRRKGDVPQQAYQGFSANRFLSIADLKNPEARIFNYDGPLNEFRSIKVPLFAVFGEKEQHAVKPVSQYLDILEQKTSSKQFAKLITSGDHSFTGYEAKVAREVVNWISRLISGRNL